MMMHGLTNPKVNLLFLKKSIKVRQPTSGLVTKYFVRFVPYMRLDNKNLLYYTILNIHKEQQNNRKIYACSTLVTKVDYNELLLI
jgi:hypothetical protein